MNDIMTLNSPEDWKLHRLGQLFRERKEKGSDKDFAPLSVTMRGIVPQLATAAKSDDGDNRKVVRVGDYAINSRSDRKGSGGISDHEGSVSLISIVLEPRDIDRGFSHHLLRSPAFQEEFYRWGHGIVADLWTTRYSDMKNIRLRVPDLPTQRAIADFLDRETARIDSLIEKKQRLVDAIKAKISDFADISVTQGLNAQCPIKSTPMPWIDAVPSHWKIVRGKYLFQQMSRSPREDDEVITAFRDGQVCLRSRRRTEGYTFAELEVGYQHIKKGDLVIHTMDAFAGAIGVSEDDGKSTGEYAVCTPIGEHNPTYFAYLLRCMAKRDYISVLCPSVRERAPRFRFVRFAPVFLPVPPREEQDAIVDAIERMRSGLGTVQNKTVTSIDRLKGYRSALITSAVTGQIDVSTYARSGTTDRQLDSIQSEMQA